MPSKPASWRLLPSGELAPLTKTQDLLVDLVPVVEDLLVAHDELTTLIAETLQTRHEARRLVLRSRRQRMELRVVESP